MRDDATRFFHDPDRPAEAVHTAVDANRRRTETRGATASADIGRTRTDLQWSGVTAIGKVTLPRGTATKTITETACALLSTALPAERFNAVTRAHWEAVETAWSGHSDVPRLHIQLSFGRARLALPGEPEY